MLAIAVAAALLSPRGVAETIAPVLRRRGGFWLCILAAVQLAWFAIATALSSRPWFSLFGSNWRRMGLLTVASLLAFVVWAAGVLCQKPEVRVTVLRAFAIAAVIASIYGIAQYFDIDPLQSPAGYHAHAGDSVIVRPPGPLGHADYFGWWLAIALFCLIHAARMEHGSWRWIAIAAGFLSFAAILLSGTRAALLGVLAGFLALGLRRFLRNRGTRVFAQTLWKPALVGLLCAGMIAAFYFSPAGLRLRARVRWSGNEPIGGARPLLWRDSLRMAAARPWTGFGPETFAAEFPRYQSVQLARLLPDFYHESPHNTLLDALAEEGLPGLLIALSWAVLGGYAAMRARCPALTAALVASCVASMFGAVTIAPLFATLLVIALLVSLSPAGADISPIVKPAIALAVATPLALALAGFGIWLAISDFQLARFQRNPSAALYDSIIRSALPGAGEDLYCARRFAADSSIDDSAAIRAAVRATATADNPPNAWYNLAVFLANGDDAAAVERALRTSATLGPNWFKPHLALANLLALTGRDSEARAEAGKAFLLDAGKDPEVTQAFLKLAH